MGELKFGTKMGEDKFGNQYFENGVDYPIGESLANLEPTERLPLRWSLHWGCWPI